MSSEIAQSMQAFIAYFDSKVVGKLRIMNNLGNLSSDPVMRLRLP